MEPNVTGTTGVLRASMEAIRVLWVGHDRGMQPDRGQPAQPKAAPGRDFEVFSRAKPRGKRQSSVLQRIPGPPWLAWIAGAVIVGVAAFAALGGSSDDGGRGGTPSEWELIARAPVEGRFSPAVAWTGSEMVLWGGGSCSGDRCTSAVAMPLDDGAAYDPATDTWRTTAPSPLSARLRSASEWTGTELMIFGGNAGEEALADGATYDPATDTWQEMAASPLSGRYRPASVWTGSELIVWGGARGGESPEEVFGDGAAYDPATDTWRELATSPLSARTASAAWTGTEMIVWGGRGVDDSFGDGAAYDPATDTWRELSPSPLLPRGPGSTIWTGSEIVYWGGGTQGESFDDGAAYDPASDTWRELAGSPMLPRRAFVTAWTGEEVVIWGGGPDNSLVFFGSGAAYDPASDTWREIPPWRSRFGPTGVWTGRELVVWSGIFAPSTIEMLNDGARLDL